MKSQFKKQQKQKEKQHNKSKKRKRSQQSDNSQNKKQNLEKIDRVRVVENTTNGAVVLTPVIQHVIQWLEKRKKPIPDRIHQAPSTIELEQVMRLLPPLKERERRALLRFVEKAVQQKEDPDKEKKIELQDSDGEYDVDISHCHDTHKLNSKRGTWPANVEFSNSYRWDASVPSEIKTKYSKTVRKRAATFSRKVYFKKITDENHPAFGEFGLYCALKHAKPGQWLLDYIGNVTLGEDQNKTSDYVSDFGEFSELACDADRFGNEARFLNDFRNTGRHPNVEFNLRRDKNGELRQGVYVKQKKDSKDDDFDGIKQDEELLVSYGKSYWRSRVGNLTDFVWRLPGHPMPKGGKPPMNDIHERVQS